MNNQPHPSLETLLKDMTPERRQEWFKDLQKIFQPSATLEAAEEKLVNLEIPAVESVQEPDNNVGSTLSFSEKIKQTMSPEELAKFEEMLNKAKDFSDFSNVIASWDVSEGTVKEFQKLLEASSFTQSIEHWFLHELNPLIQAKKMPPSDFSGVLQVWNVPSAPPATSVSVEDTVIPELPESVLVVRDLKKASEEATDQPISTDVISRKPERL